MTFTIEDKIIQCDVESLIGDNADYEATFVFDEEWDGETKKARFKMKNEFANADIVDNKCLIPVEILKQGTLEVGVYSDSITTTICRINVLPSIKQFEGNLVKATKDAYTRLEEKLDYIIENGTTPEQLNSVVQKYFENNSLENTVKVIVDEYLATKNISGGTANTPSSGTNDSTSESEEGNTETEPTEPEDNTGDNSENESNESNSSGEVIEEVLPEGCMWLEQGTWNYDGVKEDSTTKVRLDDFVDISETLKKRLDIDVKAADGSAVNFMARVQHKTSGDYANANKSDNKIPYGTATSYVATNNYYDKVTIILAGDLEATVDVTPSMFDGAIVTIKAASSVYKTITLKAHAN